MKELMIVKKARAYNDALIVAKQWYNDSDITKKEKYLLKGMFPELAESEDERIRKEITEFFKNFSKTGTWKAIPNIAKWIDWLEKQGEQKLSDIDNKFIRMRETKPKDISEFLDRLTTVEQEFLWEHIAKIRELDKEEQKPAAWSEEDIEMIGNIRRIIEQYAFSQSAVDVNGELCEKEYIEADNWLKSLKERVQPKQAWNEEIEAAISLLKDIAEEQEKDYCPHNANDLRKAAHYLEACRPQPHWKPSDEHYELEEFAKIVRGNLTGISKAVQKLFEAKYLQLTGNKMYGGFKN